MGRGGGGGGESEFIYLTAKLSPSRMISALIKMGSEVSHFNVSFIVEGKVTRQVSINQIF